MCTRVLRALVKAYPGNRAGGEAWNLTPSSTEFGSFTVTKDGVSPVLNKL